MWTVYRHTSPSGKHYFGITSKTPKERWSKGYRAETIFGKAIKKYGWENFEHVVLYDNLEEEQAKLMEISLIHHYNTMDRNFGYNMTAGGDGSTGAIRSEETRKKQSEIRKKRVITEETRKKQSESLKGENAPWYGKKFSKEHCENISKGHIGQTAWNKGIPQSEEAKRKNSEAHKGKQHTEETRKKQSESHKGIEKSEYTKLLLKTTTWYSHHFGKRIKPIIMIEYDKNILIN